MWKEKFPPTYPEQVRSRNHPSHPLDFAARSWEKRRGEEKKKGSIFPEKPTQPWSILHRFKQYPLATPHSTPLYNVSTLPLSQLVSSASRLPFPRRIPRSTGLDSTAKHPDIARESAPTLRRRGPLQISLWRRNSETCKSRPVCVG